MHVMHIMLLYELLVYPSVRSSGLHTSDNDSTVLSPFTLVSVIMDPNPSAVDHNTFNVAMDSFAKLLDDRLETFAQSMSQQSGNKMQKAARKAKRETFLCKGKGNQEQLDHCVKVSG